MLRSFRDGYLSERDCGKCEINHYYHVAPAIVEKIRQSDDAEDAFRKIYDELVRPCVDMIEASDLSGAHRLYRSYVLSLEKQYIGV